MALLGNALRRERTRTSANRRHLGGSSRNTPQKQTLTPKYSIREARLSKTVSKIKGLNAGLGYTGSDGHDLYSWVDWGDRGSVIGEFWEEGKPADGRMHYYSSAERAKLAKQFNATKPGQKLIFSR
jgi:hypothetical protein